MLMVLVLGLSVLALAVAWGLRGYVLRQDNGTPDMRKISDAIQEGAEAFLRRQYRTIGTLSIALGVRSEEHTSELQSRGHLVCRLMLEKKNNTTQIITKIIVIIIKLIYSLI